MPFYLFLLFFFFNDTATTEIYTLSLHDALPIYARVAARVVFLPQEAPDARASGEHLDGHDDEPGNADRKSTRLNSSHSQISYAVFCLKKKKKKKKKNITKRKQYDTLQ